MATASGNGAALWPRGVQSLQDCPNDLVVAVGHAEFILARSADLMEGEHPPHWMWAHDEELQAHFERVKRDRDKKFGGGSKNDDDEPPEGWVQNEFAEGLR